jgi:hypothetical protein
MFGHRERVFHLDYIFKWPNMPPAGWKYTQLTECIRCGMGFIEVSYDTPDGTVKQKNILEFHTKEELIKKDSNIIIDKEAEKKESDKKMTVQEMRIANRMRGGKS